ncbi:MAG TPA: 23S rRNA (adenine(2503)-C(2))-methyltransferase RlmN [Clostridiales bacterium]|nr:23S rRNA (adenine(2503)-C(2))-methyltransferase RlmN [Clostridiales bacterium]
MIDLLSLDQQDMEALAVANGFPKFRGKQLYEWCHKKEIFDYGAMTNLPRDFIAFLEANAVMKRGELITVKTSGQADAVKFLLDFDGALIETVLLRYHTKSGGDRNTLCVSTQAGCAMGCKFCATAKNGLSRNLTTGEIIDQVNFANAYLRQNNSESVSNIVYMGMGEPLANYDAVWRSIGILNHAKNIGMRRITVSTCGLVPAIDRLAAEHAQLTLAVSLHSANDALRQKLMPIAKKYPLDQLMEALNRYMAVTKRRVTIEYALFNRVNDGIKDAEELGLLLEHKGFHVNLIPGNPVAETGLETSPKRRIAAFAAILKEHNIETSIRESKGQDVEGACGQLRANHTNS